MSTRRARVVLVKPRVYTVRMENVASWQDHPFRSQRDFTDADGARRLFKFAIFVFLTVVFRDFDKSQLIFLQL